MLFHLNREEKVLAKEIKGLICLLMSKFVDLI